MGSAPWIFTLNPLLYIYKREVTVEGDREDLLVKRNAFMTTSGL